MKASIMFTACCMALTFGNVASAEIYETKDAQGNTVFTDTPTAEAREVDLQKSNIADPVKRIPQESGTDSGADNSPQRDALLERIPPISVRKCELRIANLSDLRGFCGPPGVAQRSKSSPCICRTISGCSESLGHIFTWIWALPFLLRNTAAMFMFPHLEGFGQRCGLAMSHNPGGGKPTCVNASHGRSIQACSWSGNGLVDA